MEDDERSVTDVSTGRHYLDDTKTERLGILDPIWGRCREDAARDLEREPLLGATLTAHVLRFHSFDEAASELFAERLRQPTLPAQPLKQAFREAFGRSLAACSEIAEDYAAARSAAPSSSAYAPLLHDSAFVAIASFRLVKWMQHADRAELAQYLLFRIASVFDVSISPAADLAGGIWSAGSLSVGDGVEIERGVSLGRGVTIAADARGAPRIEEGATIGHHTTVLGPVTVGRGARVLPGSTVLTDVAAHTTVGSPPARTIG